MDIKDKARIINSSPQEDLYILLGNYRELLQVRPVQNDRAVLVALKNVTKRKLKEIKGRSNV